MYLLQNRVSFDIISPGCGWVGGSHSLTGQAHKLVLLYSLLSVGGVDRPYMLHCWFCQKMNYKVALLGCLSKLDGAHLEEEFSRPLPKI